MKAHRKAKAAHGAAIAAKRIDPNTPPPAPPKALDPTLSANDILSKYELPVELTDLMGGDLSDLEPAEAALGAKTWLSGLRKTADQAKTRRKATMRKDLAAQLLEVW